MTENRTDNLAIPVKATLCNKNNQALAIRQPGLNRLMHRICRKQTGLQNKGMTGLPEDTVHKAQWSVSLLNFVDKNNFLHQSLGGGVNV